MHRDIVAMRVAALECRLRKMPLLRVKLIQSFADASQPPVNLFASGVLALPLAQPSKHERREEHAAGPHEHARSRDPTSLQPSA